MRAKVLIVGAQEYCFSGLVDDLEKCDCRVLVSRDGSEGIIMAVKDNPDFMLVGDATSDIDRFEICKMVKTMPFTKRIPVLFFADAINDQERERARLLGAHDFIFAASVRTWIREAIGGRGEDSKSACLPEFRS
jgi:CheY-like chemotaxis protein